MPSITLANERLRATLAPDLGAGIADFSLKGPSGYFFPLMRRAAPDESNASLLASFIMAPWANRIRAARFAFEGKDIALKVNTADGTAQHGDVRKRPWRVAAQSAGSVTLEYLSTEVTDSNWPWAYRCEATFSLSPTTLDAHLTVTNRDTRPFPAGCGHHPYFPRRLWDDRDVLEVRAPVTGRYPVESCCATGPAAPDDLSRRLDSLSPLPDQHIDAVFAGFKGTAELRWPASAVTLRMSASPSMGHLVLFAPHSNGTGGTPLPFVAVEPQTQVNDAFNLGARGVPGTGTVVLKPGESLETHCRFEVVAG